MKYNTIKEATEAWVNEMNAIPQPLLEKAYPNMDEDGLCELTPVTLKWQCDTCEEEFSQEEIDTLEENGFYDSVGNNICPTCFEKEKQEHEEDKEDDDDEYTLEDSSAYIEQVEDNDNYREYGLPMWGWLWNPHSLDEDWIKDNLEIVADCGFRIYESDEVGVLIGIDGAGYDFYEAHWIPLYKARGLQWHNESGEVVE